MEPELSGKIFAPPASSSFAPLMNQLTYYTQRLILARDYSFFLCGDVATEKVGKLLGSTEILGAEGALFRFEMKSRKLRAPKAHLKGK